MLRELDRSTNPSLRERIERGLVSNMINAKVNLGLGFKKLKNGLITHQSQMD